MDFHSLLPNQSTSFLRLLPLPLMQKDIAATSSKQGFPTC
jgi:hypothetical protein